MERLLFSRTLGVLAVLASMGLLACNSLTGADRLVLDNSDPDGKGAGGGSGGEAPAGAGAGPSVGGTGGDPSRGGGETGGSTTMTTTSETTTSTSTTTTTTTSTSTTTTTSDPLDCQYPDGGFGIYEGSVVNGNLTWQGYAEGASQAGPVSIKDYFDCDGSRGINAILIDTSAVWCGACQEEASDLPSQLPTFQAKGIRVLTLMIQDNSGNPATVATAKSWRDNYGLDSFAVVADPNFTFGGQGSVGLPLQLIVDPRTMKIVAREEGFGDYSTVLNLAQQNAN